MQNARRLAFVAGKEVQTAVDLALHQSHLPLKKSVGDFAQIFSAQRSEGGSHWRAPLVADDLTIGITFSPVWRLNVIRVTKIVIYVRC